VRSESLAQPVSGIFSVETESGEVRLVDRRSKLNRYAERFGAAFRENAAFDKRSGISSGGLYSTSVLEGARREPTSAATPRAAYGTPKDVAPSHGAGNHTIKYRDDWNCDGSGYAEAHDALNGDVGHDLDLIGALSAIATQTGPDDKRSASAAKWLRGSILSGDYAATRAAFEGAGVADFGEPDQQVAQPWTPKTTKRELQQKLSRKQRRILEAYKLWLGGLTWRQVAKEMGEPEHIVYAWQRAIRSKLGRALTTRPNCQPRHFGRFVGYERKPEKPSRGA
jgi:hypothetical protein